MNAFVHVVFGAVGLYLPALRLGVSRGGALTGALIWAASGPQLSLVNMLNLLNGAAWMPWTLLAAEQVAIAGGSRAAIALGACLAAQVVAGSETGLMIGPLVALRLLAALAVRRGPARRALVRASALALLFAVALAAATWLPFVTLARRTARQALSEEVRTHWSVHPVGMLQTALPVFPRELPLRSAADPALPELTMPYLYSLYLGLAALALAAAGLGSARRTTAWSLAAVALLAAAFALGRYSPAYDVVVAALPPLKSVRFPVKSMLLVGLSVALLAALGCDAWRQRRRAALWSAAFVSLAGAALAAAGAAAVSAPSPSLAALIAAGGAPPDQALIPLARSLALSAGVGLGVACLAVASRLRRVAAAAVCLVAALSVADLLWSQRGLNPTAPRELFRYRPATLDAIRADGGARVYFRAVTQQAALGEREVMSKRPSLPISIPLGVAFTTRLYLTPPAARIAGIASSYVEDAKGVHDAPLVELYRRLRAVDGSPAHLRLLQLGAVTHTVYLDRFGAEELEPLSTIETLFGDSVYLYRVPGALPRCYAVGGARVADGASALATLLDPGFDPSREVVLAEGEARPAAAGFRGSCRLLELVADRASLEVDLEQPGYAVLVDAYDPAWRAHVDGRAVPLLRANTAFRAVALAPGRHRVELRYRPRAVLLGAALSALAALTAGATLAWTRRRRRPGALPVRPAPG